MKLLVCVFSIGLALSELSNAAYTGCPVVKPGQVGICVHECDPIVTAWNGGLSCGNGEICCRNGCGTVCMRRRWIPTTTNKPGSCPDGKPPVACKRYPCGYTTCSIIPTAKCRADYCGGCNARFYIGRFEVTKLCRFLG